MPQMTIFDCQKDKNMTRVKNKVINVKVVLEFIQGVPELADQIETVYSLMVMKVKNV
jgi:hypothetical protein